MSRQYLIVCVTAIALVGAVAVTLKVKRTESSIEQHASTVDSKLQPTVQAAGDVETINRLKSDVQRMKASVRKIEKALSMQGELLERISLELKAKEPAANTADSSHPSKAYRMEAISELNNGQLADNEYLNTQQPHLNESMLAAQEVQQDKQRFLNLDQVLMTQQTDEHWSQTMQQQLQNLERRFTALRLNGTSMVSSDCRTSLCKVEWVHANDDEQQLAMNLLAIRSASGVSLQYIEGSGNRRPRTVAFFER